MLSGWPQLCFLHKLSNFLHAKWGFLGIYISWHRRNACTIKENFTVLGDSVTEGLEQSGNGIYKGLKPRDRWTRRGLQTLSLSLPQILCQTPEAIFTSEGLSTPLSDQTVVRRLGGVGPKSAPLPGLNLRVDWEAFHKYRYSGPSWFNRSVRVLSPARF